MTRLIKMPSYWFGDVLAVVFHIQKMFAETISQPSSCFADVKLVTGGKISNYFNPILIPPQFSKNHHSSHSNETRACAIPGTFKCSRKRCNTCPFITNTVSISGPKNSTQITDHFDCTSRNVIYCIRCTACNQLYIFRSSQSFCFCLEILSS